MAMLNHVVALCVALLCTASLVCGAPLNQEGKPLQKLPFVTYGYWCGPGHGGFQDGCCDLQVNETSAFGTSCPKPYNDPKCDETAWGANHDGVFEYGWNACTPLDATDAICRIHDKCSFDNDDKRPDFLVHCGQWCGCNSFFVHKMKLIEENKITSCSQINGAECRYDVPNLEDDFFPGSSRITFENLPCWTYKKDGGYECHLLGADYVEQNKWGGRFYDGTKCTGVAGSCDEKDEVAWMT
eukprot:Colp12_sorted_trinity150504_noHs@29707